MGLAKERIISMTPSEFFLEKDVVLPKTFCRFLENKDCKTCGKFLGYYSENYQERINIRKAIQQHHNKIRQQEFDSLELLPIKE